MKTGRSLGLVALLFLSRLAVAAPDLATAKKNLQAARETLTKAVDRIKPDPPSNADLDAARDAVEALKAAIDAGAELEQSDLDYARDSLAARKELRTQREWVDQRRANVKIFDARRAIDPAIKALADATAATQAKEPDPKAFDAARAAAAALKKLADDARPFGKQDAKFGTYLAEADATVSRQLKAIDDRETAVAVEKQRASLDAVRQAFKAAVGATAKGASDEQFKSVDQASAAVRKSLDEGKPLEAKNKAYQAEADKQRAELDATKKKMDALWSETGLVRLKAEVDPSFKDLQVAAKPLRGKPTPDQLGEARAAALVVRGLVDKFKAEAERSQAFGQYMEQVKVTLAAVESDIETRNLAAVQADVMRAKAAIEKKGPSDEQFDELNSAIGVLEKTLETVHADAPQMKAPVADANWALKEAKATAARRRIEVDSDLETANIKAAQLEVAKARANVEKKSVTDEQFAELNTAITVLEKTVEAAHAEVPQMKAPVADAQWALKEAKATAARRRIEVDSDIETKNLKAAQVEVFRARVNVEKPSPTDDHFAELNTAITVLEKTLGSVHADVPLMKAPVADAQWGLKEAKAMAVKRRLEVDVERQRAKVEEARKIAADAMAQLNVAGFAEEQVQSAESAVKLIGTVLEQGTALVEKSGGYAAYDREVKQRIVDLNGKIAMKKVALAARIARGVLVDGLAAAKARIDTVKTPEGKDSDVEAAVKAVEAVNKALETQAALEKQDGGYAAQAEKTRNELFRLADLLEQARAMRALRKATGDALAQGMAQVDTAKATTDLRKRKAGYSAALGMLRGCSTDGTAHLGVNPQLAKLPVLAAGRTITPREVMAQCQAQVETTEQLMKDVLPMIQFEDGPKKSYEAAQGLLAKGKKAEALAQVNECIATGIILAHDNPELRTQQLGVGGGTMTLSELIKKCGEQKKELEPPKK